MKNIQKNDATTKSFSSNSPSKTSQQTQHTFTEEDMRDRILNENNVWITKEFINGIFKKFDFDYKVKNIDNFKRAMVHVSYLEENIKDPNIIPKTIKIIKDVEPIEETLKKDCIPLQKKSYERLEFLGDSVIRHAIGKYLYLRYEEEEAGFLTSNRSKMENKISLSRLARKLGMQKYIIISKAKYNEIASGKSVNVTMTEDTFESFIGAFNIEAGEEKSIVFLWKIIEQEFDMPETIRTKNNHKDTLMQYYHKIDSVRKDVCYTDVEYEKDGKKRYKTCVYEKGTTHILGEGRGKSKKSSQQKAAKNALVKLGEIGREEEKDEFYDIEGDIDEEMKKTRNLLEIN
jgi:ribonuclease III